MPIDQCYALKQLYFYSSWSSNFSITFDDNLIINCKNNIIFGAHKFGGNMKIEKSFFFSTAHTQLEVQFDLFLIGLWNNNEFIFSVDNQILHNESYLTNNLDCESAENFDFNIIHIVAFMDSHSSQNFTIQFQSSLTTDVSLSSYAIQNLEIYLVNNCNPSCITCDSININQCILCPNFAFLNSTGLCECQQHFYMSIIDVTSCLECDITCATCYGPNDSNCKSCYSSDTLLLGKCISSPSL